MHLISTAIDADTIGSGSGSGLHVLLNAIFDLSGELQERIVHALFGFGTGFSKRNVVLLGQFFTFFSSNDLKGYQGEAGGLTRADPSTSVLFPINIIEI